jgi:DNA-binding response OmpR family regulator
MRILVIEDDRDIACAIKDGLVQEYFAVDIAHDGEEGFLAASQETYDLIVLDITLPGMNGKEIAQKLRAEANHSRILVLSAKDQTIDKIHLLNAGADDYLVKPFSFAELVARIKALLRRPSEKKGEILESDNLTLNTITHEVWRGDTHILLSAKEFSILEYLLRNKGQVLSKNAIVTHVWDFNADILPHTVETFIAMLRAKLDKPFKRPELIQTVRGVGYRLGDL